MKTDGPPDGGKAHSVRRNRLPPSIDNTYRGNKLAPWLLALLVLVKAAMGVNCIVNGRYVMRIADGIPLDTYTPAGEQAVVAFFALWGLSQVILAVLGLLVLVRYRGMVAFMFALFALEHLSRKLIFLALPVPKTGAPPGGVINLVLLALMIIGLILSLRQRDETAVPQ